MNNKEREVMSKLMDGQDEQDVLVVSRHKRDELIGRVEVLEKVKGLLLIPNTGMATVQQVADFYDVNLAVMEMLIKRNSDELMSDGFVLSSRKDMIELLTQQGVRLEIAKGKTIVTLKDGNEVIVPNRGLRLFPRRAILRVGMLLRDSDVAREIRTQLLNVESKAPVEVKVADVNEEQNLALAIGMAMANGDLPALAEANAKMMAFKNRHITELETTIEEHKPKVEYHDQVLNTGSLMNITTVAKDLGMSAIRLNRILTHLGIIFKQDGIYVPYAKYQYLVTDGYCDYENFYDREKKLSVNVLKWTEKGRKFIIETLRKNGFLN